MSPGAEAEARPIRIGGLAISPGRWAGWLAVGVAGLTPVFAYVGHLGYAPLLAVAGLLYLPFLLRDRAPLIGFAPLIALVLWALASMGWSAASGRPVDLGHYKGVESLTGVKLVLELGLYGSFVAASLALSRRDAARASLVLSVGLVAVAGLFIVEAVLKAPLYQIMRDAIHEATNPGWAMRDVSGVAYVIALLFWPAAVRLTQARLLPWAIALAVATVVGSFLLNGDSPVAALLVSSAVFAAVRMFGRRALFLWTFAVVLYFIAAPLLIHALGPGKLIQAAPGDIRVLSWAIRLDIWRFATDHIMQKPFFGWGLDSSRMFGPQIPLHTHDGAIQLWLELGAVGAGLATLFWVWIATCLDALEARNRPVAAAATACASAYLTIGSISFGIWQEWWLALGALTAATCIALARAAPRTLEPADGAEEEG